MKKSIKITKKDIHEFVKVNTPTLFIMVLLIITICPTIYIILIWKEDIAVSEKIWVTVGMAVLITFLLFAMYKMAKMFKHIK